MKRTTKLTKTLALIATIGFSIMGLSACGEDPSIPAVEGKFGEKPKIAAGKKGKEPKKLKKAVLVEGKGEACGDEAILKTNYTGQLWDGKVFDSSFEREGQIPGKVGPQPAIFSLNGVIKGWQEGLKDAKPGSRIELVIPPDLGYGDKDSKDIPKNSTLVFVVDILECFNSKTAEAGYTELKKATPTKESIPGLKVEGELGTEPKVVVTDKAQLPKESKVITLSEGKGKEIKEGDTIVFHILSASSQADIPASGTWKQGKDKYAADNVPPDLVGKKTGSRVMLYFPAQGERPDGILVVDILGVMSGSEK